MFFLAVFFLCTQLNGTSFFAAKQVSNSNLVAETEAIVPGKPFKVAIYISLNPGWHTYAENPGDIGKPLQINWTLPDGFTVSKLIFPPHKTFKTSGLTQYGYDKDVSFIAIITPDKNLKTNQNVTLNAELSWLVCKETCIPQHSTVSLTLPVSETASTNPQFELLTHHHHTQNTLIQALTAIMLAFLGGLLLNLMPCVLPVLSLKLLQLKESKETLAYTGGILVSFWILTAIILTVKAFGTELGWGFQLQSPWIVGGLALLFCILGLNLLGYFEIGLGFTRLGQATSQKQGLTAAFFTGVLATIVATPCTAPFMGAAIGIAVLQPPFIVFLIFSSLGLGMAFPFLVLGYIPAWKTKLPKPGAWMITLKKILAIPLFLTTLWLLGILAQQLHIPLPAFKQHSELNWKPYSESAIETSRKLGHAVFIDFTASWCLTCQVNEKTTLSNPEVVDFLKKNHVDLFKADWTNQDETITLALRKYGRNGVPVYIYYPKNKEAKRLPELLTPERFLTELTQHD